MEKKEIEFIGFNGQMEENKTDDPDWLTTDKDHAAYFGEVKKWEVSGTGAIIDANNYDRLSGGIEADAELQDIVEENSLDLIVVKNWEGEGLVCYAPNVFAWETDQSEGFN